MKKILKNHLQMIITMSVFFGLTKKKKKKKTTTLQNTLWKEDIGVYIQFSFKDS